MKQSLKEYWRIGVPSVMITYLDYWIYTVLLFLSIYLGVASNAA